MKEVYVQWFNGGEVVAFGADYSAEAAAISPDGECHEIKQGTFDGSPIGEIRTTPTLNTIPGSVADRSSELDIGDEFYAADSTNLDSIPPFAIALVKQDSTPNPLADATDDQDGLTYTWFGGPSTNDLWGRYSEVTDMMMLVKVT